MTTNTDAIFSTREDREDGFDLRTIRFGGEDVASRLFFAVRNPWWRTMPLEVISRESRRTKRGFRRVIEARTVSAGMPLRVALRYETDGDTLVAEFDATAEAEFDFARIGFCLLLGSEHYAGEPAASWRHGTKNRFAFPRELITHDESDAASERFHRTFDRLEAQTSAGVEFVAEFEGELFEFEDQRNWTDRSFKAYSVSHGWPFTAERGRRFHQRIVLRARAAGRQSSTSGAVPQLVVGSRVATLPSIDVYRGRLSPASLRPGGGFQELNARRPRDLAGVDSLEIAVNGAVHAADDDSVAETTSVHGDIVRQVRSMYPNLPLRLAPISFLDVAGDWRDADGDYSAEPQAGLPRDRQATEFAAAWVVASVAHAAPEGPDALRYLGAAVADSTPAGRAIARLRDLAGSDILAVTVPAPLAAIALSDPESPTEIVLAVANTSPDATSVRLPDGRVAVLEGFSSQWFELAGPGRGRSEAARVTSAG